MRTGQSAGHSEEKPRGTFTNGRGQTVHALTLADLESHDPGAKESGTNWRFLCPLQSPDCVAHQNPKTDRDLSLNPQTGLWKCHRCKAEGKLTERWESREPRGVGAHGKGGQAARAEAFRRHMMGGSETKPPGEAKSKPAVGALGANGGAESGQATNQGANYDWRARMGTRVSLRGTAGAAYLEGRGLPADFCHKAGVRFAVNFGSGGEAKPGRAAWSGSPAVLFCVRDADGRSVAGQGRLIAPKGSMSARLTFGPKGMGIFATPGALDGAIIVITEAPIDALSLALCGLPAVATCGTGTFPEWLRAACAFKTVLLAQDADEGGDKDAGHVAAALRLTTPRVYRLRPEGAKDWNALLLLMGSDGMHEHLRGALPESPELPENAENAGNYYSQSVQNSGHFETDVNEAEVGNHGFQTVSPEKHADGIDGDLSGADVPDDLADLVPLARELDAYFDAQEAKGRAAADAETDAENEGRQASIRSLLHDAKNNTLPLVPVVLGPGRISENPNVSARQALADLNEAAPKARAKDGDTVKPSRAWWEAKAQAALDDLDALALWWHGLKNEEAVSNSMAAPATVPATAPVGLSPVSPAASLPAAPALVWTGDSDGEATASFCSVNAFGNEVRTDYTIKCHKRSKEGCEFLLWQLWKEFTQVNNGARLGGGPLGDFSSYGRAVRAAQTHCARMIVGYQSGTAHPPVQNRVSTKLA